MRHKGPNWNAALRRVAHSLSLRLRRRERSLPGDGVILGLAPDSPSRQALEAIAHDAGFALTFVEPDCVEGERRPWSGPPPIMIYDVAGAPEAWRERIRTLARNSPRPYIILLASKVDLNLLDELQRLGGSDILCAPVSRERLVEAIAKGRQLRSAQEHLLSPACPTTK